MYALIINKSGKYSTIKGISSIEDAKSRPEFKMRGVLNTNCEIWPEDGRPATAEEKQQGVK